MDKQLFKAAGEGNLQVVKSLLAQGANIEYQNDDYVSQVIFYLSTVLMLNNIKNDEIYDAI